MGKDTAVNPFDAAGRYIIPAFDRKPPFSSFLPGIAGLDGVPMWVFYTNRGQAISSFGVKSKDGPILEFQPANKTYQQTALLGFRTFIKSDEWFFEPFNPVNKARAVRKMLIGLNELELHEVDPKAGIETAVLYFNLVREASAGLVRRVRITNLGKKPVQLEVLDGLPALVPYGVDDGMLKNISRTIEAWMEVIDLASGIPFYRLRASAQDTSEIQAIRAGNFALAGSSGELLQAVVDPQVIFGSDTSLILPQSFQQEGLSVLLQQEQITEGRTPSAFFAEAFSLAPGQSHQISSVYGFTRDKSFLQNLKTKLLTEGYLAEKQEQSRELANQLTDPISTRTGNQVFDGYIRQTFLDNILRGGWPQLLGDQHIYYTYSRKHGDPERDYNQFYLAAENYSQGNGNYRDVNQNRRSDVFFQPRAGEFNLRLFLSLIQLDGYNPLVVKGTKFILPEEHWQDAFKRVKRAGILEDVLRRPFSPGELLDGAHRAGLIGSPQAFLDLVLGSCRQQIEADAEEGYWIDHWTYNLDLIDSYLKIYPDRMAYLLFESEPLPFFDSAAAVNPRSKKYVLEGRVPAQHNAVTILEEKQTLIDSRQDSPHWARTDRGRGEIFRLSLFSKLVLLALIKFASRDPSGLGIEMEAGKPGWCDALNGLPGMFGSSLPASYQLARLLDFLIEAGQEEDRRVSLPEEAADLFSSLRAEMDKAQTPFAYWDAVSTARETYRERTQYGVDGALVEFQAADLLTGLRAMQEQVQQGLGLALEISGGIAPTYFAFKAEEYEVLPELDQQNRAFIRPHRFSISTLPLFLEGPVCQMSSLPAKPDRLALYHLVKDSLLFDPKLGCYKLNASLLDQPFSIGRIRAFSRGWLENESIWLHMTYKYLLEILRAGLYEEFYRDLKKCLPPFLDPLVYGRSPLENSSFIVSSAHPDSSLHGRGFVARLTGATAELISIWFTIMTGGSPFSLDKEGRLQFALEPKLPGWLFPADGVLSFQFLGSIPVRVHNPEGIDTWMALPASYTLREGADEVCLPGPVLPEEYAKSIREGRVKEIDLHY